MLSDERHEGAAEHEGVGWMSQRELEAYIVTLDNVQRDDSYGYAMYFVGDDHMVPFVSLAAADNEYDRVSNLDREGVYRVNIGVTRKTFAACCSAIGQPMTSTMRALNVFMPHPHLRQAEFYLHSQSDRRE